MTDHQDDCNDGPNSEDEFDESYVMSGVEDS